MKTALLFLLILLCCCTHQNDNTRIRVKTGVQIDTSKDSLVIQRDIDGNIVFERTFNDTAFTKKGYCYVAYPITNCAQYKGGKEALQEYLDSCYYQRPGYDYQEYSFHYVFNILFNKDMKILDVRITYLSPNMNRRFDELLKEALYNSEGNWEPKYKDRAPGYMMYNGRCHFW